MKEVFEGAILLTLIACLTVISVVTVMYYDTQNKIQIEMYRCDKK